MERAIRAMTQSSSGSAQWRTAHNFHLGITFLLELPKSTKALLLGFHRAHLSLRVLNEKLKTENQIIHEY
jgi:hypothetical protein